MRFFRGARSPGNTAGEQGDRVCGPAVTDPGLSGQLAAAFAEPPGGRVRPPSIRSPCAR
jgi:hypothetical protein